MLLSAAKHLTPQAIADALRMRFLAPLGMTETTNAHFAASASRTVR